MRVKLDLLEVAASYILQDMMSDFDTIEESEKSIKFASNYQTWTPPSRKPQSRFACVPNHSRETDLKYLEVIREEIHLKEIRSGISSCFY